MSVDITGVRPYANKFPPLPECDLSPDKYYVVTAGARRLLLMPAELRGYWNIAVALDGFASADMISGSRVAFWCHVNGINLNGATISARTPVAPRRAETSTTHVYFIADEDGYIKIGFANSVQSRLDSLQTASRQRLRLLASMPGTLADEHMLHARFAGSRVHGEWFRPSPDLHALIAKQAQVSA